MTTKHVEAPPVRGNAHEPRRRHDRPNGPIEKITCLVGTMVQEAFRSGDAIRASCEASIKGHAQTLEADLSEAIAKRGITGLTAHSLALHTQAVLQGAFILAKATGDSVIARASVLHLKRYCEFVFKPS